MREVCSTQKYRMGFCVATGAALGAAFGVMTDNIESSLAIGIALGIALAAMNNKTANPDINRNRDKIR